MDIVSQVRRHLTAQCLAQQTGELELHSPLHSLYTYSGIDKSLLVHKCFFVITAQNIQISNKVIEAPSTPATTVA